MNQFKRRKMDILKFFAQCSVKMARMGLNGFWGIHLAPKALCLFNARRQHPPKNDKFMNQFHMPFDRQSKL